jgi:hypothetical protein
MSRLDVFVIFSRTAPLTGSDAIVGACFRKRTGGEEDDPHSFSPLIPDKNSRINIFIGLPWPVVKSHEAEGDNKRRTENAPGAT